MVGQTLSHYRILGKLGSGGMGVVYRAEDLQLGRQVALKFLSEPISAQPASLDRFTREARAASALNHPNICTIYEIGEADGKPFIAMELLEGQSLDHELRDRRLALGPVLEIAIQLADGLDAAHAKGIVHRDVKPANLFLTKLGQLKILDFGLAKLANDDRGSSTSGETIGLTAEANLTSPGAAIGTISYMSPEQARGDEIDRRSDLFSAGSVLYETVSGQLPFPGKTSAIVFESILNRDPIPPLRWNPHLPEELQRIIGKCLEKDPDVRYQSAAELRADLKRLKRDSDSGNADAVPIASSRRIRIAEGARQNKLGFGLMALISAIVLAAAGYGIFALLHRPHAAPFQSMNISKLTDSGTASLAAISPDGKYVVHVVVDAGQQSLWMRHTRTNSVAQIVPSADTKYSGLTFSPDGNYIYYTRVEKGSSGVGLLYQIPVLGGLPRLIVTDIDSRISFSPDGRRFAFRRESPTLRKTSTVLIADADGSHEQKVAELALPAFFIGNPAWSPDGKTIAIMDISGQKTGELGQYVSLDVATGRKAPIAPLSRVGQIFGSSWLPDGSGLLVVSDGPATNWNTQIALVTYPAGEIRRVTNDLNRYANDISTTADGRSLVSVAYELPYSFWIMPASGTATQAVPVSSGRSPLVLNLDWTADGRILWSNVADSQGFEINVRSRDGTGKTTIFSAPQEFGQASACGDGRFIVFSGLLSPEGVNVWRVDSTGGNQKKLTSGQLNQAAVCSPDGQWVAYNALDPSGDTVLRVSIDGGTPVRLSSQPAYSPAISPDGRLVAFVVEGQGANSRDTWAVVPSGGGAPIHTINFDPRASGNPRFAPDGKSLAYVVTERGVSNVWAQPLAGGAPKQLTDFKSDQIFDFSWSRDGKLLALFRGQASRDVVLLTDTTQ